MSTEKKRKKARKLNVRLLRRAKRAILKHPDQFEMAWWFLDKLLWLPSGPVPAGGCGTAGCIGGWVVHLASKRKKIKDTGRRCPDVGGCARRLLRLNPGKANALFGAPNWPNQFSTRYYDATTPLERAKAAADRIEWFIKHGE